MGILCWKNLSLDRIEFIDYGTDPAAWLAAAEADEVDCFYENVGEYVDIMEGIGWENSEIATGSTILIRPNQTSPDADGNTVYADKRVRQALAMAVDNNICLELGYANKGQAADNHHAVQCTQSMMHPLVVFLMILQRQKHLWQKREWRIMSMSSFQLTTTGEKILLMRLQPNSGCGIKVKRTILPGSTFWNDWAKYPFSSTNWNHRPFATQVWGLAYRSGEAWNEMGWSNAEFDALLAEANAIADADKRRAVAGKCQALIAEEGCTIQPYWRSLTEVIPQILFVICISLITRMFINGASKLKLNANLFGLRSFTARPILFRNRVKYYGAIYFKTSRLNAYYFYLPYFIVFFLTNLFPNLEKLAKTQGNFRMSEAELPFLEDRGYLQPYQLNMDSGLVYFLVM